MTTLTIYTSRYTNEFVLAVAYKLRVAVVAAHALQLYESVKAVAVAFFKAWCEVPLLLLCVKGNRRLVQVTITAEDVRIGVLARPDDVIYLLFSLVYGITSLQPELQDIQRVTFPVWLVVIVQLFVVHQCMHRREIGC